MIRVTGCIFSLNTGLDNFENRMAIWDGKKFYRVYQHWVANDKTIVRKDNRMTTDWRVLKEGDYIIVDGWKFGEINLEAKNIMVTSYVSLPETLKVELMNKIRQFN